MKTIILAAAAAVALSACTSLQHAGMAEYTVKPMIIDKQTVCCEVSVKNGKEYASLKAKVQKTGNDYMVTLEEQTVQAFAGQKQTADFATNTVEAAATLGASVIAAPAVGVLGSGLKAIAQ